MTSERFRFGPVTLGRTGSTYTAGALRITETYHPGGTSLQRHYHEDFAVNVVMEGVVEERAGRRTHRCTPGTLLAKPPGQQHSNRYFGSTVRCMIVQLSTGFAGLECAPECTMERVAFRKGEEVQRSARRLARVLERPELPDNDLVAWTETWRLLSLCTPSVPKRFPPRWLAEARGLLGEPGKAGEQLGELCARVGVPLWMLSRAFERTYGVSPSQYRRRKRLDQAARWLAATDTPISELAHRAGFADHSHLVRWFRRAYGRTPTEYRARMRRETSSGTG
jgi:AraC-like DNA-binding protein/mannose-6-phosphate isomerase-like protein (cupin superfamily)